MTKKRFTVIIEQDSDGMLIASVPDLQGCHTQAKTLPTLLSRIKEAIQVCLDARKDHRAPSRFVGLQEVEIVA